MSMARTRVYSQTADSVMALALLDLGSELSFVMERVAQRLSLPRIYYILYILYKLMDGKWTFLNEKYAPMLFYKHSLFLLLQDKVFSSKN